MFLTLILSLGFSVFAQNGIFSEGMYYNPAKKTLTIAVEKAGGGLHTLERKLEDFTADKELGIDSIKYENGTLVFRDADGNYIESMPVKIPLSGHLSVDLQNVDIEQDYSIDLSGFDNKDYRKQKIGEVKGISLYLSGLEQINN